MDRDGIRRRLHPPRARAGLGTALLLIAVLILGACGAAESDDPTATSEPGDAGQETSGRLVIGNIDATNPSEKIEEFQPLADYLVEHLESAEVSEGSVLIARDPAEMARMLDEGEVDIYIDAAIPSLQVCELAGCEFSLRQWKGGGPTLAGVFITTEESGIASIDDLTGKVIMLEQPHSTVGHILPLVTVAKAGLTARQVDSPEAEVGADEVGYYVSSGGQTSMNLLLNGEIDALAIGDRAYKKFDPAVQEQVVIFAETVAAPSQLVTFRPGFDPELQQEIVELMVGLEGSPEGQEILKTLRDTQKFEELPDGQTGELAELYETVKTTLQE